MSEDQAIAAPRQKQFPCKQCGAKVEFQPGADALSCPYCGTSNPIPKSEEDILELDYEAQLAQLAGNAETIENLTVKCKMCAAETTLEANVTAAACAYCGADIVTEGHAHKEIKPKSLLPFKVDRKRAFECFRAWLGKLWFAPNDLKKFARSEDKLAGLYVPYWTYDCDTTSFYRGERGDDYWTTESYTTTENGKTVRKTRQVRRTRWRSVSGTVWNDFNDVLVLASRNLPRDYAEKLEPWDLRNLVGYKDEYLSGFRAESYQIKLPEGFGRAKEIMYVTIEDSIEHDIGGDHQRIHAVRTRYDHITFKHILLPVWLASYRYRQKVYRILVNARTGEVQGERPWSWIKIALAVLAAAAVAGTVYYLANAS